VFNRKPFGTNSISTNAVKTNSDIANNVKTNSVGTNSVGTNTLNQLYLFKQPLIGQLKHCQIICRLTKIHGTLFSTPEKKNVNQQKLNSCHLDKNIQPSFIFILELIWVLRKDALLHLTNPDITPKMNKIFCSSICNFINFGGYVWVGEMEHRIFT